jgi:tetratricopeptide (TPR) repeat protein
MVSSAQMLSYLKEAERAADPSPPLGVNGEAEPPASFGDFEPAGGHPAEEDHSASPGASADDPSTLRLGSGQAGLGVNGGLLDDLPASDPSPEGSTEDDGLLGDIPTFSERPGGGLSLPRVEVSPAAAAAIAKEYERELRDKLEEQAQHKTFLQRHGLKLALGTVVGLAIAAAGLAFFLTRAKNNGRDLKDLLAGAKHSFQLDTAQGYRSGLDGLSQAAAMDSNSEEVWALIAYGRSIMYAEHGENAKDLTEAVHALNQPGVKEKFPGLALVARYNTADPRERDGIRRTVLDDTDAPPEVEELAGRLLLQSKDAPHAVKRFERALKISTNNVRALVALGNYYRESGDYSTALQFYATAAQLSPQHTELVVGEAECKLALWQDFASALEDMEKLPKKDEMSPSLALRREMAHARLVGANGSGEEAVPALQALVAAHPGSLDLQLALGEVLRECGDMVSAEHAYEAVLKAQPNSEAGREGLGRVLIARDHERDVLTRLPAEDGAKRVLQVRAAAYAKLGEWNHVRSELQKTQVKGKFPVDSVVYLALADAAEQKERTEAAQAALEKARGMLKHPRPELSVALGKLYWQRGQAEKARVLFEEAMKDPLDYEGACSLGRLLVGTGNGAKALPALKTAVKRNGSHGEARHAYGRLLLAQGQTEDGLKQAEAWQADNPASSGAWRDYGFALAQIGRFKDAEVAASNGVKLDAQSAEGYRIKAEILFALGNGRDAFSELERANKLDPKDAQTFCSIGHAFLRQANGQNAERAFEAALRESPDIACGKVGLVAGRLPAASKPAIKDLGEVIDHGPAVWDRAWAAAELARVEVATGNMREAKKFAEMAQKLGPHLAEAWFAAGTVALKAKDDAKAKAGLEQAVALEPTQASYHLALADFLARADQDVGRAMGEYELFLKLAGKSPEQNRVKKLLPLLRKRLARR